MVVHHIKNAGYVVPGGAMDGRARVKVPAVPMATVLTVHSSSGKHRGVIGKGACPLANSTSVQGVGTFAHEPVERWSARLSKSSNRVRVEAIDGDGDHMINRIVGIISRLVIGREDRRPACRRGDRRRRGQYHDGSCATLVGRSGVTSGGEEGTCDHDGRPRRPEPSSGHELDPNCGRG